MGAGLGSGKACGGSEGAWSGGEGAGLGGDGAGLGGEGAWPGGEGAGLGTKGAGRQSRIETVGGTEVGRWDERRAGVRGSTGSLQHEM